MEDGLKNLIFLVVALLAWGIKAAMERKRGRSQPGQPGAGEGAVPSQSELSTGEVDVVYGRRRLPPQITAAPASFSGDAPPVRHQVPDAGGSTSAGEPLTAALSGAATPQTTIHKRTLKTTLQATGPQQASEHAGAERARRAWRRLGVDRTRGARRALRTAVLWREVLGPPRALRGPHRPPRRSRRP